MKLLAAILVLLALSAPALADDPPDPTPPIPHFLLWRDQGRLHLLTEDLSNEIDVGAPTNEAERLESPPPGGEIYFREDRTGFEFRRAVPLTPYGEMWRVDVHQNRDGSVIAEFWTDLSTDRITRKYPDLAAAFRDSDVCRAFAGALKASGQNPEILTLTKLKAALGWKPLPDFDTHQAIMRLIDKLDERDAKARRLACVELHQLSIYLPAVLEVEKPELDAEQASRIQWAVSDTWVDGTPALIWLAQDIFLNE